MRCEGGRSTAATVVRLASAAIWGKDVNDGIAWLNRVVQLAHIRCLGTCISQNTHLKISGPWTSSKSPCTLPTIFPIPPSLLSFEPNTTMLYYAHRSSSWDLRIQSCNHREGCGVCQKRAATAQTQELRLKCISIMTTRRGQKLWQHTCHVHNWMLLNNKNKYTWLGDCLSTVHINVI
jgi:hypothetical protein